MKINPVRNYWDLAGFFTTRTECGGDDSFICYERPSTGTVIRINRLRAEPFNREGYRDCTVLLLLLLFRVHINCKTPQNMGHCIRFGNQIPQIRTLNIACWFPNRALSAARDSANYSTTHYHEFRHTVGIAFAQMHTASLFSSLIRCTVLELW